MKPISSTFLKISGIIFFFLMHTTIWSQCPEFPIKDSIEVECGIDSYLDLNPKNAFSEIGFGETGIDMQEIAFANENTCLAIANKNDGKAIIFRSSNAGKNWSKVWNKTDGYDKLKFYTLQFVHPDTGIICGIAHKNNQPGKVYILIYQTVDGGNVWNKMFENEKYNANKRIFSYFKNSKFGYVFDGEMYTVSDNFGLNKYYYTMLNFTFDEAIDVSYNGKDMFAALNDEGLLTYINSNGKVISSNYLSWNNGSKTFHTLEYKSQDTLYLSASEGAIMYTGDGGNNWLENKIENSDINISDIKFYNKSMYTISDSGNILISTNNGLSWRKMASFPGINFKKMMLYNDNLAFFWQENSDRAYRYSLPQNAIYQWTPGTLVSDSTALCPSLKLINPTVLRLTIEIPGQCSIDKKIHVRIKNARIDIPDSMQAVCGDYVTLKAAIHSKVDYFNDTIRFDGKNMRIQDNGDIPIVSIDFNPSQTRNYLFSFTKLNTCKASKNVFINVSPIYLTFNNDTPYCGDSHIIKIGSNNPNWKEFKWDVSADKRAKEKDTAIIIYYDEFMVNPIESTWYKVSARNNFGCFVKDSVQIHVKPLSFYLPDIEYECGERKYWSMETDINDFINSYYITIDPPGVSNMGVDFAMLSPVSQIYTVTAREVKGINIGEQCRFQTSFKAQVVPKKIDLAFSQDKQFFSSPPFDVNFFNTTQNKENYDFVWHFGDGKSLEAEQNPIKHSYQSNGVYDITLIAIEKETGCVIEKHLKEWIFCGGGKACESSAIISSYCLNSLCDLKCLKIKTDIPDAKFQWNKNGIPIHDATNDSLVVWEKGWYSATVYNFDCSIKTSESIITLNEAANNSYPILVYPNPSKDVIYLTNLAGIKQIDIITTGGIIVKSIMNDAEYLETDISGLHNGIYFIRFSSETKNEYKKIIKQ